jgi:hypothetical protein
VNVLWIFLGFCIVVNNLYLVMIVLQLIAICFDVIIWASILAFLPMVASSYNYCAWAMGLGGKRGGGG